jgi:hypothetical protein
MKLLTIMNEIDNEIEWFHLFFWVYKCNNLLYDIKTAVV